MSELRGTLICPVRSLSLSEIAEEQAQTNQRLEGDKVIKNYGMYALIPESMTSQVQLLPGQDHESESSNHSMENLRESHTYQHARYSQRAIDEAE